jgi:hypothetical protein
VMSDRPTPPFIPQTVGSDGLLPDASATSASATLAPQGSATAAPEAAAETAPVPTTSSTAWLVWLVGGLAVVALLVGGGWALTRNRASRNDFQPSVDHEPAAGADHDGPPPETARQAVARPAGRTAQGEDTP